MYASSGTVQIAYQVIGDAGVTVVLVPGFVSHVELAWENPQIVDFYERLSRFARVIVFDKRGTGMSDPVEGVPTMEERMDDVRAVMDATATERAVLLGVSEGGPMCILFAATYPERTQALILCGAMARTTWAPDYPFAAPREALLESAAEFLAPSYGTGEHLEIFAPSIASDPSMREWHARWERLSCSPAMMRKLMLMFLETDVREALPLISAPTLVMHRTGDRVVSVHAGRWLARQISGARLAEFPGADHILFVGEVAPVLGEIEEFVTGQRGAPESPDRVLATVLFADIVDSTAQAAALGDSAWARRRDSFLDAIRRELARHRGTEIKTTGDGLLATFDGPGRGLRCAAAIDAAAAEHAIQIRQGLHSGECDVRDGDVSGIAVHIAARVAALADAGEILASSTVRDLVVGSDLEFVERGSRELRGVPGEWRLYALAAG